MKIEQEHYMSNQQHEQTESQKGNEPELVQQSSSNCSTTTSQRKQSRKQQQKKKQQKQQKNKETTQEQQLPENEVSATPANTLSWKDTVLEKFAMNDHSSAWQSCVANNSVWGGRGKGGRGEYAAATNSIRSNIHLSDVSVTLPNGQSLLSNTNKASLDITRGHRYGLIGRNGVGKSTLLQGLALHAFPGMPSDVRVLYVQQQVNASHTQTPLTVLLESDQQRTQLLQEQEQLEQQLDAANQDEQHTNNKSVEELVERLNHIATSLEIHEADTAVERATEILQGLQFTPTMLEQPTAHLSGGWRMRLALAQALFVPADLLLLDECTNHLDLYGLNWLINYLTTTTTTTTAVSAGAAADDNARTLIVVSHDRSFLDAVCTDMLVLEHQSIRHHVGNYSSYQQQERDKKAREAQILDAAERQRNKAAAFVQKQQQQANKKSADPNKQRQAKMVKDKKMDRIGNYRSDGKRYKLNSLKQLSEDHVRLAEKVVIQVDEPIVRMNFPPPSWPPAVAPNDAIVRLQDFSFAYDDRDQDTHHSSSSSTSSSTPKQILSQVTVQLNRGSKVALVGRNGAGKSTLVKLIAGEITPPTPPKNSSSLLWRHPNLRIGHMTQYAVEELENKYANETVVSYAEQHLLHGKASSKIVAQASGNVRQYLGMYGLGGTAYAHRPIRTLSGGERMRLCFATVLAQEPHILLMDESTNHVDIETLESMSAALNQYTGTVLMVSHNQGFLSGFCQELWVLEDGRLTVNHSGTESFDEIFSQYRNSLLSKNKQQQQQSSLVQQRRDKANMAKRATQQRTGARQNTALL